jgi:hypothetical protein
MTQHASLHTPFADPPPRFTAYAMEVDDMAIGVALAVRGGFVFHAIDRSYLALEGQRFRHVNQVSRVVRALRRGSSPVKRSADR